MPHAVRTLERVPYRSESRAASIAVLRRCARVLTGRLPELTDRVVAIVREQEPSYRSTHDGDLLWHEAHRSLRNNVGCLIRPHELRDAARSCTWRIGVTRARAGLPLDALLHAFRLGGRVVWQELLDIAAERDPEGMRLLVHVAGDMWNFVDEHCALAAEAYRRTERELAWRLENRVRLMTEALLHGTAQVAELPEIAAALDLDENGHYAVAVVSGTGREGYRPAGSPRLLWHRTDTMDVAIALLDAGGAEELAQQLAPAAPAAVRIGVSPPAAGLAAIGDARAHAEKALLTCPGEGEVALLDEHLPAALLVSSPELGAVLMERALGPLLRLDPLDRDVLMDTLTAYLECDASAQRAGERLSCHRNTVLNRLRRYERLTGRSLASPLKTAELSLALTARRVLPAG